MAHLCQIVPNLAKLILNIAKKSIICRINYVKKRQSGFTLVEVLMASFLACITLTCIVQFFLTQLNQYRYISSSNKINESLRIFSKFLEKDVHNALKFYVFDNLDKALAFTEGNSITIPTVGNCVLFVQERGMVEGGRGVIYHVGEETTLNGQNCYPLYRALVTFSANKKINEVDPNKTQTTTSENSSIPLINLTLGYLPKGNAENDASEDNTSGNDTTNDWPQFFSGTNSENKPITGIFYTNARKRAGSPLYNSTAETPYVAGCRRGLFVGTRLIQPGFRGVHAETLCNFCFFSRNPRF